MTGATFRKNHFPFGLGSLQGNVAVIAVSNAVKVFGAGIIGIYVPLYFIRLGGSPVFIGIMTSVSSIIQCIFLFLGGFIADYHGRRRIIVLTAFYGTFFPLFYAMIPDWRIFAMLSVIAVIGVLSSPASHAIVADSVPPKSRAVGIASLQVVSSLPATVSPLIGGWLIQTYGLIDGFRLACIYVAVTALASALILFLFLKETLNMGTAKKSSNLDLGTFTNSFKFSDPLSTSLKALMLSYALIILANGAVGQYYILYVYRVIGLTPLEWGAIVSMQLLLANILKIPGGWLSDRFGKKKMMTISVLTCAPCTVLFTLSTTFVQVSIVALLLVLTGTYYAPVYEALQADLTPRDLRGRVTALWGIASTISLALGALLGGFLFEAVNPNAPFYLFTLIEVVAAFITIGIIREPAKKEI